MEWLLILAGVVGSGGGAIVAGRRWRTRREEREAAREELETIRAFADEDVTLLGEELSRLDARLEGAELDEDARVDYQTALDAYETAGRTVSKMTSAEEVSLVTDALTSGRYALACVQARVAGQPLPTRRTPCFFNPQHGPAASQVMWRARGRGTRQVPACAQDAARIAAGEKPDVREVRVNGRKVAYWEAGAAFAPYLDGYFLESSALNYAIAESHGAAGGMFGMVSGGGLGDMGGNGS